MKKVRIGVLGGHRGTTMIDYCKKADNAEVVAICDKLPETLEAHRQKAEGRDIALYDNFDDFKDYKWKIALPAPALYGQFDNLDDIDYVLNGLLRIGFDDVYEVSKAAELVSAYTRFYLNTEGVKKPVISSACPAVMRLIALRYPSLSENVMRMLPPMEIAAKLAREKAQREHPELKPEEIGVCFISPCPAKVSYVKNGFGDYKSQVDVVVSIKDIYFLLINAMSHDDTTESLSESGMIGIGWARSGGEASALFNDSYLAADGIENVNRVLDQIENGNIPQLEFVELNACTGGCVGGVMTIQNPFIAKARLQNLRRYLPVSQNFLSPDEQYIPEGYFFDEVPEYRGVSQLGNSMAESMRMMADIQALRGQLPGLDCGACGAPTCRAFAEDVVQCKAKASDCLLTKRDELYAYLAEKEAANDSQ